MRWLHWITPLPHIIKMLSVNEFLSPGPGGRYDKLMPVGREQVKKLSIRSQCPRFLKCKVTIHITLENVISSCPWDAARSSGWEICTSSPLIFHRTPDSSVQATATHSQTSYLYSNFI